MPLSGQQPPESYQPTAYQPQAPAYGTYQQPYAYSAPYASIGKRFVASLLDGVVGFLGALPGLVLFFVAVAMASSGADVGALLILLSYPLLYGGILVVSIYNIYLLGRDGATLGKRWMGMKVLDPMGQPLGFWKALVREFVKGAVGGACFILLLWPLWDNERQGLHDKLFNTHVFEA
jgi:uncharacterized RDD family membrane protein YckC